MNFLLLLWREILVLIILIITYPVYYKKRSKVSYFIIIVTTCTYFGYLFFLALDTDKGFQFPLIGSFIGFILFVLLLESERVIGKSIFVDKVSINLPQFANLQFVVDNSSKKVAWSLFVETITRIATQPIESGAGKLREALASLYSLFNLTRELLKGMNPSSEQKDMTIEMLSISMLNRVIRPRLEKWHKLLSEFEKYHQNETEDKWEYNEECRKDLEKLRNELIEYSKGFAKLAHVKQLDFFFDDHEPNS